ncbi:acetyltransferase [Glaesserella parasuis]|uniref:Acetyltransferase n=1 Tax=Glaesserella parasuis TaxID=738 RepID=T1RPU5_GLAPU|nr:acetyltransferase [Glaesserella parasuis]EQA14799.1 sugar O-acyltransferase, sialic acid O-acetyltransferase NeuD family protein [Glaesserella parasuis H465]AGM38814.1 putative acetyltransferase [Glaesserella parasuis]AMW16044.1 acetyltransferase [Glaesserella parasuis]MDG6271197.1 acetyltransferase [Glaesserella parasuis]MDG6306817.1 acetyltransferase [Glaesserella parasuis]
MIIGIYGASGFGKEVLPLVRMQYPELSRDNIVFIDDSLAGFILNDINVISYEEFIGIPDKIKSVVIAIADGKIRKTISEKLSTDGIRQLFIKAVNSIILDNVEIGDGSILCPFTCLTSNIKIGRGFQANIYSYVAHDCIIGDYVTFAPGVKCNGNVHIEDNVYIGTGAIIKQGTSKKPLVIGKGAVIGMGAVVMKSVPEGAVLMGNPARSLREFSKNK